MVRSQVRQHKHKVCVVTTSRADYGIYRSVLAALAGSDAIDLSLIVGGTHLEDRFGHTVDAIERDGYAIAARVASVPDADQDVDIAVTMGEATSGFARALNTIRPDLLMVLGDRYEMFCAALAALPLRIPVAHIHGGEETEGAMDNSLRHAMTKLSHLHLCSTELAAERIRAMGEDPSRIIVTGAPALDSILAIPRLSRAELTESLAVPNRDFLLMTHHPETLRPEATLAEFDRLWDVVENFCQDRGLMCLMTLSNADTMGQSLNDRLDAIARDTDFVFLTHSMGASRYYSAMAEARLMVGNSSSGIIEAASVGCPVVNIGDRQRGREQSANTIDAPLDPKAIRTALEMVDSDQFRADMSNKANVYGDGTSGVRICDAVLAFLNDAPGVAKTFRLGGAQ